MTTEIRISEELAAGIRAYEARIAALGGYGTRIRVSMPDGEIREGALIERGAGGGQPGIKQDDGRRFAIDLDRVLSTAEVPAKFKWRTDGASGTIEAQDINDAITQLANDDEWPTEAQIADGAFGWVEGPDGERRSVGSPR